MDISELDYFLPESAVAQFPAQKRDESRLLVFDRRTQQISHHKFLELDALLPHPYSFVRNDAAVLKARIFGRRKSGGLVEILLLSPIGEGKWRVMLRPAKKLRIGEIFGVENIFRAELLEKFEDGQAMVNFVGNKYENVVSLSEKIGVVPLPPYIARDQKSPSYDKAFDNERYQTVYANSAKRVAAAAPTAGLHFTKDLEHRLIEGGNTFHSITLHVGIGTFQPIKTGNIADHKMHSEIYEISRESAEVLKNKTSKKLMVGTTSLRASEDFLRKSPDAKGPYLGDAKLFIYPPQKIISADALITNFHLPRSTLLCLVAAFISPEKSGGVKILKEIYAEALKENYRFFSYGDAMLIL